MTPSYFSSVIGICEISLWVSNVTPPPQGVYLSCIHNMDKIPEIILKLIWICQFLSLGLPQSEVDESQGKLTIQVYTPNTIDVYARKFQSTDKFIFNCPSLEVLFPLFFVNGSNLF